MSKTTEDADDGLTRDKLAGLWSAGNPNDDTEVVGLTLAYFRTLDAMGDGIGGRAAEPSEEDEQRAREAMNERERQLVDASDATAVEALASIGVDVRDFSDDEGLSVALRNIRAVNANGGTQ